MSKRFALAVVSAACVGFGIAGSWQTATAQGTAKAAPTSVAVINLNRILDSLAEAKDAIGRLETENQKNLAKLGEIETQIKAVKARLDALPKGQRSPERAQLEGQFLELNVLGRARRDVLQQLQDVENGTVMLGLYNKISDAVKRYAEQQQIDVVLSDDQFVTLEPEEADRPVTWKDVARYSNDRQIIFAAPRIDLTDQIITMMNNEYNAKAGRR